jgi:dTMP kinase
MLVAVEGVDGSGKGTQARLLEGHARGAGLGVTVFSFPRYGNNAFSDACARYLNGEFGSFETIAPELSALVYAGDRFAARGDILDALEKTEFVICDRYVASNIAHQGARYGPTERAAFVEWLEEIEYDIYQLPRPELTVLLTMPPEIAHALVLKKAPRAYTPLGRDIIEGIEGHGATAQEVYLALAERGPNWRVVDSVRDDELRPPEEIAAEIWEAVRSLL